jgi:hypothetical protein
MGGKEGQLETDNKKKWQLTDKKITKNKLF